MHKYKILLWLKFTCSHVQTAMSNSSSLWNWQYPKCCFIFQNQFLHSCCIHIHTSCAGPTSATIIMDVWQLSNTLHPYYHYSWAVNFNGRNIFHTHKQNHTTNFFTGPSLQCHGHCTALNSIWLLTLVPPVARYTYYKCYRLPKNKMLD
jgi:hypothetical protein